MDRAAWIDAFVMKLNRLGCECDPHVLIEIAKDHCPARHNNDPCDVVHELVTQWGGAPQHD